MFLGFNIPVETRNNIDIKFSKQNVKKRIKLIEKKYAELIKDENMPDKTVSVFDTKTGFQSNHVSDYKEGDWKNIFTAEQQKKINGELDKFIE